MPHSRFFVSLHLGRFLFSGISGKRYVPRGNNRNILSAMCLLSDTGADRGRGAEDPLTRSFEAPELSIFDPCLICP